MIPRSRLRPRWVLGAASTAASNVETLPPSGPPSTAGPRGALGASEAPQRSLRVGFSWTLAGNVVYGASQWGMLAVIAKLGAPEMVGQFALAFAITAPVFMFANLNLAAVQSTDATFEHPFADYYSVRWRTTALALALLLVVIQFGGYPPATRLIILIVAIAKSVEALSDIYLGLYQRHERMDTAGISLLVKGPLSFLAVAAAMYFSGRVLWSVLGLLVVWTAMLLLYDRPRGRALLGGQHTRLPNESLSLDGDGDAPGVRIERPTRRHLVRLALPMGFVAFANSLIPSMPRYFVERHLGVAELGIFAAMAYVFIAGQMLAAALASSARPRLATYYARGNREAFTRLTLRLVYLGTIIGAGAVLAALVGGRRILTLLYAPEYATHASVFTVLMAAAALSYVGFLFWNSATAARRFDSQVPLFATAIVVTLGACAVFVPRFGLMGAALAVLASAVVQLTGSALILVRATRMCGVPASPVTVRQGGRSHGD